MLGGFATKSHAYQLMQIHILWNHSSQHQSQARSDPPKNFHIHWNPYSNSENIQTHWNLSKPTEIYEDQLKHVHTPWKPSRPLNPIHIYWPMVWTGFSWSGQVLAGIDGCRWVWTGFSGSRSRGNGLSEDSVDNGTAVPWTCQNLELAENNFFDRKW